MEKHEYGDSADWIHAATGLRNLDEHIFVAFEHGYSMPTFAHVEVSFWLH